MLAALIGGALAAPAAEGPPEVTFTPSVDVRGRAMYSYTEGLSKGFRDDVSAVDRARFGLELERSGVVARVAAQQYRAWKADPNAPGEYVIVPPDIELFEAYAQVGGRLPGGLEGTFTVGRQLITLHRGQLVSERDFDFRGLPLDVARVQLVVDTLHLDVFNYRDFGESGVSDPGSTVVVVGAGEDRPVTAWLTDLALVVETPAALGTRATAGPVLMVESGRYGLGFEAYAQVTTHDETDDADDEAATLISAWATATVGPERLVQLGVGYEEWTGNLLGTRPGGFVRPAGAFYDFHGHMNLFLAPEDTAFRGLRDASVSVVLDPRPRVEIATDLHAFWLGGDDGRSLGTELDVTLRYWFASIAAFEGAWFTYAGGPGTSEVADLPSLANGYLQLRVGL